MMKITDKKFYMDNIYFLAKKQGKKISEVEKHAGVSVGYFSRLLKKNNTTIPSIDVLCSVSDFLEVTLDSLLYVDFSGLTPTEEYIINLIDTLMERTLNDETRWDKEPIILHQIAINDPSGDFAGMGNHPLYVFEEYDDPYSPKPKTYNTYYNSQFHDFIPHETKVFDNVYNAEIGKNVYFTIVPVKYKEQINGEQTTQQDIELYLIKSGNAEAICNAHNNVPTVFNKKLNDLYLCAKENSSHTKISETVKSILDDYIKGKKIIVDDGDLPFY